MNTELDKRVHALRNAMNLKSEHFSTATTIADTDGRTFWNTHFGGRVRRPVVPRCPSVSLMALCPALTLLTPA